MRPILLALSSALTLLAQGDPYGPRFPHGWGMSIGTAFDAAPLLLDVHYTFRPGIGFYLGGGGRPHPGSANSWNFDINFNDRGTLRRVDTAGYLGVAITRQRNFAWGLGYGRHSSGWEIDHGGWFTAEEQAKLDTTVVRAGPHGWLAYYPGRVVGFQFQVGPGWGGVSLALRFF